VTNVRKLGAQENDVLRRQVSQPLATVWRDTARSARERQLQLGDVFLIEKSVGDLAYGQSEKDGYVGFVATSDLGVARRTTHTVRSLSSHFYDAPSLKTPFTREIFFGSSVKIVGESNGFCETDNGHFIPTAHLRPSDEYLSDFVKTALMFEHVPYLWGGNSVCGIDCSGLVQAALMAAGIACPGDAYLQEKSVGRALQENTVLQRGDLLFWPSHVAMVLDADTIFHATAGFMYTTREPLRDAISRIAAQGEGSITSRRRP